MILILTVKTLLKSGEIWLTFLGFSIPRRMGGPQSLLPIAYCLIHLPPKQRIALIIHWVAGYISVPNEQMVVINNPILS